MVDVIKPSMRIGGSGDADGSEIRQILHGTVAIDFPSVGANGAVASASASVNGLSSAFSVLLIPQAWVASESIIVAAAAGITNGIQATATNPSAGAINATSANFSYWAWR